MGRSGLVSNTLRERIQDRMNRLLVFALFCASVLALSAGSEDESAEKSLNLVEPEISLTRDVRSAGKKNKQVKNKKKRSRRGKKAAKKSKKGRKPKRGKKSKKGRKPKRGKKSLKSKKKSKKQKKNKKKDKKKSKKRRNGKKKSKGRKKKSKKQKKSSRQAEAGCEEADCLTNVVKYLRQMKDKVSNFGSQKLRIEKFTKVSANKGAKKSIFPPLKNRLVDVGGGNESALTCAGDPDNAELNALVSGLDACVDEIDAACNASKPEIDDALIEECATKMDTFSAEVKKCQDITEPAELCTCWNSDTLKNASAELASCDISKLAVEVAAYKKKCVATFSTCKKLEDSVAGFTFACSSENDPNALLLTAKAATENKAALEELKAAIDDIETTRMKRQALSCADFAAGMTEVSELTVADPSNAEVATKAKELIAGKPASCSAEELEAINSAAAQVDAAIAAADSLLAETQALLETLTGSTASADDIANATTAAATTATAASTTSAVTAEA